MFCLSQRIAVCVLPALLICRQTCSMGFGADVPVGDGSGQRAAVTRSSESFVVHSPDADRENAVQAPPGFRKPIYAAPTDPRQHQSIIDHVTSLSEPEMLAIVPTQTGIRYTACPNCEAGRQESGDWQWTPAHPEQIRCKGCSDVFPNNAAFPDDKVIRVEGPHGDFLYPYHERPDGRRFFFRARADLFAQGYMTNAAMALARRYWLTRDEACGRRAALIMLRFAEAFPGWPYAYERAFEQKRFSPWRANRIDGVPDYRVSRWYYWVYGDISAPRVTYWLPGVSHAHLEGSEH